GGQRCDSSVRPATSQLLQRAAKSLRQKTFRDWYGGRRGPASVRPDGVRLPSQKRENQAMRARTRTTPIRRYPLHGVLLLAGLGAPLAAPAETDQRLDTVVIRGAKQSEVVQARQRLEEVPGGTSLIDSEEVAKGRNSTLGDVLAYQPGVFVQSVGGNDSVKISIRGSGVINSPGYFREGIKFLYDGIALTGTGGTTYELLNASGVDYTEVLRGGNAFEHGALALGGAVNFVTHT